MQLAWELLAQMISKAPPTPASTLPPQADIALRFRGTLLATVLSRRALPASLRRTKASSSVLL